MIDEVKFRQMIREEVQRALAALGPQSAWLSQQDAAEHCGVNVATIRNWHRQGLKVQREGKVTRYARTDLDAFMRRGSETSVVSRVADVLAQNAARNRP
jgi:hypothetical protein